MTAYANVQLAVKGLKYGAADFVTKPWDNNQLVRTLREAIEKNREVMPPTRWSKSTCKGPWNNVVAT